MKYLFLDVDGVLNSEESFRRTHEQWIVSGEPNKATPPFSWPLGHLDPVLIERLNTICEQSGCRIVLSSSWRLVCKLEDFKGWLKEKGFKYSDVIIDITPNLDLKAADYRRGMEIKQWLDEHPNYESYVILDDDSFDILHVHPKNFVHCSFREGLQDIQVEKAIKILDDVKAPIRLSIDEVNRLIDYHEEIANNIPKEHFNRMTMAGHTLEITHKKQKTRAIELRNILDETWPK